MRIGILTFHFSDNFGALLQAYALRRWFLERGHQAEFIDYRPQHVEQGGRIRMSLLPADMKANAKTIYLKASSFFHRHFGDPDQADRFRDFRARHLGIDGAVSYVAEDLDRTQLPYDMIVAGSDQIWSPSVQYGFDPVYFLAFAGHTTARRISYAASFGRDDLPPEQMQALAPLLRSLSAISVRELSAVEIIGSAAGLEAACVPDPTLLHDRYDDLLAVSRDDRQDHVFCYALRTGEGIRDVAGHVSRRLGAPIISPYNVHRRWREIGTTVYPGPAEWLSYAANSRFVVTNSFHGTVFSVLLRRPFLVAEIPGTRLAMNARSRNLLTQLGLMDRFVGKQDLARIDELIDRPIDWEEVEARQRALRQAGSTFLEQQLQSIETAHP